MQLRFNINILWINRNIKKVWFFLNLRIQSMFTCVTNVKSKVNKVKGAWLDQHKKNSLPILLYTPPLPISPLSSDRSITGRN